MPSLNPATAIAADVLDALPDASALALNENPFSPLPGVRAALIESVDVANRYPVGLKAEEQRLCGLGDPLSDRAAL